MPMTKPRLLIVMPCYNEAKVLGGVINSVKEVFDTSVYGHTYSILVVDDCSKDNSAAVAKKSGATVVSHIINQGAGGSTATGLNYARKYGFDLVVTMDSDGQHRPLDALACVKELEATKSDLVIGSRMIDSSGMSLVKKIGNWGLTIVTLLLFGVRTTDSQSGLRAYGRRAIEELDWKSTGYDFASEMLWRAKKMQLKLSEFPIQVIYTDYSKGKGQNNWNGVNIVVSLVLHKVSEMLR